MIKSALIRRKTAHRTFADTLREQKRQRRINRVQMFVTHMERTVDRMESDLTEIEAQS